MLRRIFGLACLGISIALPAQAQNTAQEVLFWHDFVVNAGPSAVFAERSYGQGYLSGYANGICSVLDRGYTVRQIIPALSRNGMSPEINSALLIAGVNRYCPRYADQIRAIANETPVQR